MAVSEAMRSKMANVHDNIGRKHRYLASMIDQPVCAPDLKRNLHNATKLCITLGDYLHGDGSKDILFT